MKWKAFMHPFAIDSFNDYLLSASFGSGTPGSAHTGDTALEVGRLRNKRKPWLTGLED